MPISLQEAIDMAQRYHVAASSRGDRSEVADFFTHPDGIAVHILHGDDLMIDDVIEAMKGFTDHHFEPMDPWTLTPLCEELEKARVTGAIYWRATPVDAASPLMEAIVGEDWVVERGSDGKLRFSLYINPYHHQLPGSASTGLHTQA
ncbi:MAG: hypothetical protein Q7V58_00855 [Actinomycetota bacterium]|nr:hypothetical protein [Actinomycetota bacterium]